MTMSRTYQGSNRTMSILHAAQRGKYSVLAAIAYNIEHLTALVQAAESARSPLILQIFPSTLLQLPHLAFAAAHAVKTASVPLSLHIDHAQDESHIRHIIDHVPVDSIMVDMSHFDPATNLAKTAELTALCHARGIAVEAESGRIEGGEDGITDTAIAGLDALLTTDEDIEAFIAAGVDVLAPSVGNVHGEYGADGPRIRFQRLGEIRDQVRERVVIALHGTNGFEEAVMKRCVGAGAVKLNVNKLLLECAKRVVGEKGEELGWGELIEEQIRVVREETERWMRVCGSSGKA